MMEADLLTPEQEGRLREVVQALPARGPCAGAMMTLRTLKIGINIAGGLDYTGIPPTRCFWGSLYRLHYRHLDDLKRSFRFRGKTRSYRVR